MGVQALVLNSSYEPINIVSWQKAIQLLFQGKVEVVEESDKTIRTVSITMRIPSVLRLLRFVPLKRRARIVRFSRLNIFIRDAYSCQYCGHTPPKSHLTLDHVVPAVQGGLKDWTNIVTSCKPCNQRKGGRTPEEAGMKLRKRPVEPSWLPNTKVEIGIQITPESWRLYLKL